MTKALLIGGRTRLGLTAIGALGLGAALLSAFGPSASAQRLAGANRNANGFDLSQGAPSLPPPPPQGAWGEVIMANPKWIVVQNHRGEQFPIANDSVGQFLIRWPILARDLTANSVVEAIGQDLGSNTLDTDHADVFEGADQQLVAPTYSSLLPNNRLVTTIDPGFNRFMNGFDIGAQNLLYGWAYPVTPGMNGIPARLHVVGNVTSANPLQLSVVGNNLANVVSSDGGLTLTQVTRGDSGFADKGDVVFLMPTALTARSVTLTQLVLYKKMPRAAFRRP